MSVNVAEKVEIYFDLGATGGDLLTLDDPTKGQLDSATYVLGGDVATDVSAYVRRYSTTRGRSRELDEMIPGSIEVEFVNYDGRFIPNAFGATPPVERPFLLEDGTTWLLEDGVTPFLLENGAAAYGDEGITLGRRITVSVEDTVVFDGIIDSWRLEYTSDLQVVTIATAYDSLAQLGYRRFNAWTTTGSQVAGERIDDVLDRSEIDWGANRSLYRSDGTTFMGVSSLQSDNVSYGSNVLNYCQLVAKSDLGRFFADRKGVLTYIDRLNLVNPTLAATFTDAGADADIGFQSASLAYGGELLYTDVSVDREGGTAQTSYSATARASFGIRRLDVTGLLLDSDDESKAMADYLLGIYSQPQPRIEAINVNLDGLSAAKRAQVAGLDIADLVSIEWTPRGGIELVGTYVVEGIRHDVSTSAPHMVALQLSPIQQAEAFVLDNTSLGVLDSGVLAF